MLTRAKRVSMVRCSSRGLSDQETNQTAGLTIQRGRLTMQDKPASLYTRLGGYDAIAAVIDDLLPRLRSDVLLSRFWTSPRSVDTHNRERQLAVDFIAAAAGGPTYYLGRDMKVSHKGMGITKADYAAFMRCLALSLDTFEVSEPERSEVVAFITSLEPE